MNDTVVAVFICHTQNLVITQSKIEGDVSELFLHFEIAVQNQFTGAFQEFIIRTALHAKRFEACLGVVASQDILSLSQNGTVQIIVFVI